MEAIVVGAGVIGLTTGVRLLEAGFEVRIISRQPIEATTSVVAGAIWYPYLASGERIRSWALESLNTYRDLSLKEPAAGVDPQVLVELVDNKTAAPWWHTEVSTFRRLSDTERRAGCSDGWRTEIFRIEPLLFLTWLRGQFEALGGELHFFPAGITDLKALTTPDRIVVNCSGLGARTLSPDARMTAVRGVVLRIRNPGLEHGWILDRDDEHPCYIFPRRNDCILGGTAEFGVESMDVGAALRDRIFQRCEELEPRIRDMPVFGYAVGMRPYRDAVRLESEQTEEGGLILHNYGHGGNGFTLAWGCAEEIVKRAVNHQSDALSDNP